MVDFKEWQVYSTGDVQLNPGPPMLNFTHLNIHSLATKSAPLHNYLISNPTDILSLNETLLQPTDSDSSIASFIPPGYSIIQSPRLTGLGGGVAVIFRHFLKLTRSKSQLPSPITFETLTTKLTSGNKETIFINIYRRPPTPLASDKLIQILTNTNYPPFSLNSSLYLNTMSPPF